MAAFNNSTLSALTAYDGVSNPKEFVRQFKLQAFILGWDGAQQATVLPFYLTGKARQIFDALPQAQQAQIDTALTHLETQCTPSKASLLRDFYQRAPFAGETYVQYGLALHDLLQKAVPNIGNDERIVFLRDQLCEHLPENLRSLVQFHTDKPWENVLQALDSASASSTGRNTRQQFQQYADLNRTAIRSPPRENTFRGTCHYCHRPGHRIADCRKRMRANSREHFQRQTSPRNQRSSAYSSQPRNQPYGDRYRSQSPSRRSVQFNPDLDAESSTIQLSVSTPQQEPTTISDIGFNALHLGTPL